MMKLAAKKSSAILSAIKPIQLISLMLILVISPVASIAQTCTLDTRDARFQAEVYKLAAKNSESRKAFDGFKEYFGLSKTALDLIDNLQTGKFTKELQFIQAWHEPNKVVGLNTSSANFSRWKVQIGPGGAPPSLVSKTAAVFGVVGHTLTGLSLALNAYDAFNGDTAASKAAAVDIYKTTQGLMVAKYGTQSLSLAMVGVGFMDYALNTYMKTAYVKYEDYWWEGYANYLNRTYSRASWAKLYQTQGQAGVDARLREFWADAYVNVGTNNQGKLRSMANDALAMATYPEPFAARYMSEALVPRLNYYFKEKAEEARIDLELLLDKNCDVLAREITKIRDLEKTIKAARVEMAKRANEKTVEEKEKKQGEEKLKEEEGQNDTIDDAGEEASVDLVDEPDLDDRSWNEFLDFLSDTMKDDEEGGADADDAAPEESSSNDNEPVAMADEANGDLSGANETGDEGQPPFVDDRTLEEEGAAQSEWDDLEADADANPQEYEAVENKDIDTPEEETDDWDTIDEVDDTLYGADQNQINAIRDQMAGQVSADSGRINSNARQDFAQIQAERERRRIQRAKERAEFAAAMQELADGLSAAYYGTSQPASSYGTNQSTPSPSVRSDAPAQRTPPSQLSGNPQGITQAALKRCIDAKYAASRGSGFPIMDPNIPRFQCMDELRGGGSSVAEQNRCNKNINTAWNKKTNRCERLSQKVEPAAQFGTRYESGGAGVHTFNYVGRPQPGASLSVDWEMYKIPDRLIVYYDGRTVLDTGMISNSGSRRLPPFSGSSVKVVLTGGGNNTQWEFRLGQ